MKCSLAILLVVLVAAGCTSKSRSREQAQIAYLAGQNMILQQQAAAATQARTVTVVGAVQNPQVAWVEGLTLVQAVATAKYIGVIEPKQIVITHQGESVALDVNVLFNGPDIPLEAGDVVELRP